MQACVSTARNAPRVAVAAALAAGLLVISGLPMAPRSRNEARSATQVDDEDERSLRQSAARAIVRDNCLLCHSDELITGQKLTQPQWKAEVEKMIGWGAPVAADQVVPLVEYLSEQYSESTPTKPPARIRYEAALAQYLPQTGGAKAVAGDVERGAGLYRAHCATCHGDGARGGELGPNLVEVPALVRGLEYAAVVRDGRRRMPGFRLVLDPQQEADVLAWLQTRRYESPAGR